MIIPQLTLHNRIGGICVHFFLQNIGLEDLVENVNFPLKGAQTLFHFDHISTCAAGPLCWVSRCDLLSGRAVVLFSLMFYRDLINQSSITKADRNGFEATSSHHPGKTYKRAEGTGRHQRIISASLHHIFFLTNWPPFNHFSLSLLSEVEWYQMWKAPDQLNLSSLAEWTRAESKVLLFVCCYLRFPRRLKLLTPRAHLSVKLITRRTTSKWDEIHLLFWGWVLQWLLVNSIVTEWGEQFVHSTSPQ